VRDVQNQIESTGTVKAGFDGNNWLVPGWWQNTWNSHTMMESACGLREEMLRAAGWQDGVSHHTDQEQNKQNCQGEYL